MTSDSSSPTASSSIRPQRPRRHKPRRDITIAYEIKAIQDTCRAIPAGDMHAVKFDDNPEPVLLHRPGKYDLDIGGVPSVAWPSLIASEGLLTMPLAEYQEYVDGRHARKHMPFVKPETITAIVKLLKEYSFYRDVCAFPGCTEGRNGKFDQRLDKKAELLVRHAYYPPAFFPIAEGDTTPVMELRKTCYLHWYLPEIRDELKNALIALEDAAATQPLAERSESLTKGYDVIIDMLYDHVCRRSRQKSETPPARRDFIESFLVFISQMSGDRS